jgi:undecaprenyl-diphosphatase
VTYLHAALLGVVQGLTEFLPISSTAHLLIGERLLGHQDPGGVFAVMIQFGSVLAVMWLYREKIIDVTRGLASDPAARRFHVDAGDCLHPCRSPVLLSGFVKGELYQRPWSWRAFILGGLAILLIERAGPRPVVFKVDETPVPRAFAVGVFQMLALVPGVSRSGATIMGGMLVGLDRPAAAEFSFFLAMPALAGAFLHDLWEVRDQLAPDRHRNRHGFVLCLAALVIINHFSGLSAGPV